MAVNGRSRQAMLLPPFRPEQLALPSEPRPCWIAIDNSVDAEVPEVGSELAPRRQHDDLDVVEKRERQNRALRALAFSV